jgi:hypothetical protein
LKIYRFTVVCFAEGIIENAKIGLGVERLALRAEDQRKSAGLICVNLRKKSER